MVVDLEGAVGGASGTIGEAYGNKSSNGTEELAQKRELQRTFESGGGPFLLLAAFHGDDSFLFPFRDSDRAGVVRDVLEGFVFDSSHRMFG